MATVNQMQMFGITFGIPEPKGSERRRQPPTGIHRPLGSHDGGIKEPPGRQTTKN